MKLFHRLSRSTRCASTPSQILYGFNGKVIAFDSAKEGSLKQHTGFESGDRVRSYSGNRVGQVGVVIGMRNNALFIKYNDAVDLEAYHLDSLGRADLRLIDHIGIKGLDPTVYTENDVYNSMQYLEKDAKLKAKMPTYLDDAAIQHLTREQSSGVRCQRCSEQRDFEDIRTAVESLGQMHYMTQRIIRLFSLESDVHPKLTSKDAINKAIDEVLTKNQGGTFMPADAALSKIIQARAADFDHLQTVQVSTQSFELPNGILRETSSESELKDEPWVSTLRGIPSGAQDCRRIKDAEGSVHLPSERLYDALSSCKDDATVRAIASSRDLHLDEPVRDYYLTALQLSDGDSIRPYTTLGSIKTALGDGVTMTKEAFTADLAKRVKCLNDQVVVSFPGGSVATIPVIALKESGREVTIIDEPWCRNVVETHSLLPKGADNDFYGKSGRVRAVARKEPIESDSIAAGLLHRLSLFKGRHTEEFIPFADVYIPDGQYKYLNKACAVELYANADEKPTMYDAGGLPEYKSNAWVQSFNLTNQYALDSFAPPTKTGHSFNRKVVNFTNETPTPDF